MVSPQCVEFLIVPTALVIWNWGLSWVDSRVWSAPEDGVSSRALARSAYRASDMNPVVKKIPNDVNLEMHWQGVRNGSGAGATGEPSCEQAGSAGST